MENYTEEKKTNNTVIRVVKNKDNPYVMLNKVFLSDDSISWKAKGILAYMLSKPDDWKLRVKDLIKQSTDGTDSVYSGLKELRSNGYMQLIEYRCKGKIVEVEYLVCEQKQPDLPGKKTINIDPQPEEQKTDESIDIEGSQPLRENPETEGSQPLRENPNEVTANSEKPDYTNIDITDNDINNNAIAISIKELKGEAKILYDKINKSYNIFYKRDLSIQEFLKIYKSYI